MAHKLRIFFDRISHGRMHRLEEGVPTQECWDAGSLWTRQYACRLICAGDQSRYAGAPRRMIPAMSDAINKTRNTTNKSLAPSKAAPARVVNPNTAAIREITRKRMAALNMRILLAEQGEVAPLEIASYVLFYNHLRVVRSVGKRRRVANWTFSPIALCAKAMPMR